MSKTQVVTAAAVAVAAVAEGQEMTAAQAAASQEFDMVVDTPLEMDKVQYKVGEPIKVRGIETVRWLERTKTAHLGTPEAETAAAESKPGTQDEQGKTGG